MVLLGAKTKYNVAMQSNKTVMASDGAGVWGKGEFLTVHIVVYVGGGDSAGFAH